jgi:hypothetical protein
MLKRIIVFTVSFIMLSSAAFADPYFNILADELKLKSETEAKQLNNNKEFVGTIKELYVVPSSKKSEVPHSMSFPAKDIKERPTNFEVTFYLTLKEYPGYAFIFKRFDDAVKWGLLIAEKEASPGGSSVRCKGWKVALTTDKKVLNGYSKKQKGKMVCYELLSLKRMVN